MTSSAKLILESEYREISRAIMSPDVYGGASADEHVPRWVMTAEGERDDCEVPQVILSPENFPAGTIVTISVPVCQRCDVVADLCDCGFDWHEWAGIKFS